MCSVFKDNDNGKANDKAKAFISRALESNRKAGKYKRIRDLQIFVGCKRISPNELMNI